MSIRHRLAVSILVACLFSSSALVAAKVPADGSIAPIEISRTAIHWKLQVPSAGVTITVIRPDGEAVKKEFRSPNPSLAPSDLGFPLEDGIYTYELAVSPVVPAHVQQRLQQARKDNDDVAARKALREAGLDRSFVESGVFSVVGGSFVLRELNETTNEPKSTSAGATSSSTSTGDDGGSVSASAGHSLRPTVNDQVIPDDLIVQASLCVGFDCVNGENFGADTIRMKENNTRIHFEDTSTSAGFAANDWRIMANDQPSGGANKFSIDDVTSTLTPFTLRAGAPSNSIFVGSNGKLGLKTATPQLDIHVTTGDTPAWRMEQNSTSGFTAQTWDIGANEANFFVRDVTGGSRLPFRIRPGAPTSSIDISVSGKVGIGTGSPNGRLNISSTEQLESKLLLSGQEFFQAANTATDGIAFLLGLNRTTSRQLWIADSAQMAVSSANTAIRIQPTLGEISAIGLDGSTKNLALNIFGGFVGIGRSPSFPIHHSNGALLTVGGVWTNASSREYKQDVTNLEASEAMETLQGLSPVKYAYKLDPQERHAGFIAEDVPDLVATADRKGLSPMDIVAVLTKVVQEQQKTIDELSERLGKLEADPEPK